MLDAALIEQLKGVFSKLEGSVELVVETSQHPDQVELLDMLEGVASASSKISVVKAPPVPGASQQVPRFSVHHNGRFTGIRFTGIPGGHEFSSLVLAILNSDRKGKMPDEVLQARIQSIKGPIRVKTFVSLTCENCPDVVQALNQMAILHSDFEHEMVVGNYAQEEIDRLKIQGVPSVVVQDKLIHSGRASVLELVEKLEQTFGISDGQVATVNKDLGEW
ncbi:MAG: thioredoxin family protein, partial [Bdellovibrionaceae bacterium]|nr:thioredoxin family protein [Pseudobdellovibrionaceae bacterium]